MDGWSFTNKHHLPADLLAHGDDVSRLELDPRVLLQGLTVHGGAKLGPIVLNEELCGGCGGVRGGGIESVSSSGISGNHHP